MSREQLERWRREFRGLVQRKIAEIEMEARAEPTRNYERERYWLHHWLEAFT